MPELPEVETVRRGLALRMSGRRIVQAELRRPDLRRPFPPMLAERLDGARIGGLARRGKYILIELDETGLLLLHLGMSGRITANSPGEPSGNGDAKHDHVVLTLDDGTVVRLNDARRFGGNASAPRRNGPGAVGAGVRRRVSRARPRRQDDADQIGLA